MLFLLFFPGGTALFTGDNSVYFFASLVNMPNGLDYIEGDALNECSHLVSNAVMPRINGKNNMPPQPTGSADFGPEPPAQLCRQGIAGCARVLCWCRVGWIEQSDSVLCR